jgi:hypothetical protein
MDGAPSAICRMVTMARCSPRQGDPGVALETPETPRRPMMGRMEMVIKWWGQIGWFMIRRYNNKSTNDRFVNFWWIVEFFNLIGGPFQSGSWEIFAKPLGKMWIIVGLRNLLLTRIWLVLLVGHAEGQMPQRVWILNKLFNSLFTAFWTHHIVVDFIIEGPCTSRSGLFKSWLTLWSYLIFTCLRDLYLEVTLKGPWKTPCHHPNAATRSRSGSNPAEKCHGVLEWVLQGERRPTWPGKFVFFFKSMCRGL